MDNARFIYLIKTLSRTKRKDYENYVINAVWNKLNDTTIKPASQWYVKQPTGWHLIDLYFPQINFGVECDEAHHKHNRSQDEQRELTLIEVLSAANKHPYQAYHIDVTRSYEAIEAQITGCVEAIRTRVNDQRQTGEFVEWTDSRTVTEQFKDRRIIYASDDILFPRIVDTVNSLMGTSASAYMKGYFTPKGLDPAYKFWYPQLEINGKAQTRGWHNMLSEDSTTITEYNDDIAANMADPKKISEIAFLDYYRVTFAKVRDPITNERAYKFVGVFKLNGIDANDVRTYVKIADSFNPDIHKVGSV